MPREYIRRCVWVDGEHSGRWVIQTYHLTGIPWCDEECPHYRTREDAREALRA